MGRIGQRMVILQNPGRVALSANSGAVLAAAAAPRSWVPASTCSVDAAVPLGSLPQIDALKSALC